MPVRKTGRRIDLLNVDTPATRTEFTAGS